MSVPPATEPGAATVPAPAEPAPVAALPYAPNDGAIPEPPTRRAWALLPAALAGVTVLMLPITNSETPAEPMFRYVRGLLARGVGSNTFWEAVLTGPFWLPIPLTWWTCRLARNGRLGRLERMIAWCIAATTLAMTLLACGYTFYLSFEERGGVTFFRANLMTLLLLSLSALLVQISWRRGAHSAAALFALALTYACNTAMTILILRTHAPWTIGMVVAACDVFAILAVVGWLSRKPERVEAAS